MTIPAPARYLLDRIGSKEAPHGYDTVFGNLMSRMPKPLTSMTINEVIAQGNWRYRNFGSSACGRYQFMEGTLNALKRSQRLTGAEKMTPELQDRLGYALLLGRGYAKFMAGQLSIVGFGLGLAQEWASFPVLAPTRGAHRTVQRGQTYYLGDGLNKVLATAPEVESWLKTMRPSATAAPVALMAPEEPKAADLPQVTNLVTPDESGLAKWLPWLGKKKPRVVAARDRKGLNPRGSEALWDVQEALRTRAYYTKGFLDGLDGPLTQEAVSQARKDNGLGDGGVDEPFLAALPTMPHRPVSADRAKITLADAAKHAPELFGPAKWLGGLGIGTLGIGSADGTGLLDNVQTTVGRVSDVAGSVQTSFGYVSSAVSFLVEHRTLVLVLLGLVILVKAAGFALDAWIKVRSAFF